MISTRYPLARILSLAAITVSTAVAAAAEQNGRPYYFDNIADTSGAFSFFFRPSINNAGQIAFKAWQDGVPGEAIYRGPNPVADQFAVAIPNAPFLNYRAMGGYSLNAPGGLAFSAIVFDGQTSTLPPSIYSGPNSLANLIPVPPIEFLTNGPVSWNAASQAIMKSTYTADGPRDVLVSAANGVTRVLAHGGTYAVIADAVVNDAGTVAISATRGTGATLDFNTITNIGNVPASFVAGSAFTRFDQLDLNNAGTLVFAAAKGTVDGVFVATRTSTPGQVVTIAQDDDSFDSFRDTAINSSGKVIFTAHLSGTGGNGLFAGGDANRDAVLAPGDSLFGGTVQDVAISRESLNDSGKIVFRYTLGTDEGSGIAYATPALPGDANVDRAANITDFAILAGRFGQPGNWNDGDFDLNGTVGIADFAILASRFGQTAAGRPAAVPEPAIAGVLAAGLLFRRRRTRCGG